MRSLRTPRASSQLITALRGLPQHSRAETQRIRHGGLGDYPPERDEANNSARVNGETFIAVLAHGRRSSVASSTWTQLSMSPPTCGTLSDVETRRTRLAAIFFVSSIQYFVVQYVVARRWHRPYSVARNTISDLGSSVCERFDGRYVCSPWHTAMNVSFVVLGLTMVAGSRIMWRTHRSSWATFSGFVCLAIGGIGVVVVGVVPENSVPLVHGLGAALPFLVGNIGVLLVGFARWRTLRFRASALILGAVSLFALFFYTRAQFFGLGVGGMERVVAYPQTIWLIIAGTDLLAGSHWTRETAATAFK